LRDTSLPKNANKKKDTNFLPPLVKPGTKLTTDAVDSDHDEDN